MNELLIANMAGQVHPVQQAQSGLRRGDGSRAASSFGSIMRNALRTESAEGAPEPEGEEQRVEEMSLLAAALAAANAAGGVAAAAVIPPGANLLSVPAGGDMGTAALRWNVPAALPDAAADVLPPTPAEPRAAVLPDAADAAGTAQLPDTAAAGVPFRAEGGDAVLPQVILPRDEQQDVRIAVTPPDRQAERPAPVAPDDAAGSDAAGTGEANQADAELPEIVKAAENGGESGETKFVTLSEMSIRSLTGGETAAKVGENYDVTAPGFEKAVAETVLYKAEGGVREFEIELSPAELGRVKINVVFEDGRVGVTFVCENPKAESILGSHADGIRAILETVAKGEPRVTVKNEGGSWQGENFDGSGNERRQYEESRKRERQETSVFIDRLRLHLTAAEAV